MSFPDLLGRKYTLGLAACVLVLVFSLGFGLTHRVPETQAGPLVQVEQDVYRLSERTLAEFQPVLIEKFCEQSRLVVYTAELSQTIDLETKGLVGWSVFAKTKSLSYRGTGRYYIDLADLGANSIRLDNARKTVIVTVPRTKLEPVEIDPDRFTATDTKNGILSFGEMKFTAEEYNALQKVAKARMTETLDTPGYFQTADGRAVEELTKIFTPVVQSVDAGYTVEIEFVR